MFLHLGFLTCVLKTQVNTTHILKIFIEMKFNNILHNIIYLCELVEKCNQSMLSH